MSHLYAVASPLELDLQELRTGHGIIYYQDGPRFPCNARRSWQTFVFHIPVHRHELERYLHAFPRQEGRCKLCLCLSFDLFEFVVAVVRIVMDER